MYFKSIVTATCTCLAVASFNADAALVSRLGGLAYYDDVADLTWLADANAAVGSAYDTYYPGSGIMNWADANAWTASLNVDGVTGWRLPTTLQPDASCSTQSGSVSYGYNCTGSELGNLFYNVLGGAAGVSITATHNTNYDLFSNVQPNSLSGFHWSATESVSDPFYVWEFSVYSGIQGLNGKTGGEYTWAVHSGDVSAVPVPAAAWLFGSGLMGLIGVARRKKA
jgi:hypothetical protein